VHLVAGVAQAHGQAVGLALDAPQVARARVRDGDAHVSGFPCLAGSLRVDSEISLEVRLGAAPVCEGAQTTIPRRPAVAGPPAEDRLRLYTFPPAPNPTKLGVYLAEKGIEIPCEIVNIAKGEQHAPGFRAKNPLGAVPVLELDDGSALCESLAIIEYLEELHPEPPMIGRAPLERARVREIERIIDLQILQRVSRIIHNTRSPLPGVTAIPEVAEKERARLPEVLAVLDARIGDRPFVTGERPSIADCTLFAALRFAGFGNVEIDAACENVHRWYASFSERPSAR
jgi:glutathione S-transferase